MSGFYSAMYWLNEGLKCTPVVDAWSVRQKRGEKNKNTGTTGST